jgi:hypothetical protein
VLVLTGGAAAAIQPLLSSPAVSIADLVLKGLAHYATTAR